MAAHIKRRAQCSQQERVAFEHNVVPMCKLGCDELFERGYIYVLGGVIKVVPERAITEAVANYIKDVAAKKCARWSAETQPYFTWHAERSLGGVLADAAVAE